MIKKQRAVFSCRIDIRFATCIRGGSRGRVAGGRAQAARQIPPMGGREGEARARGARGVTGAILVDGGSCADYGVFPPMGGRGLGCLVNTLFSNAFFCFFLPFSFFFLPLSQLSISFAMSEFLIRRVAKSENATLGYLYVNGQRLCRTLEPLDRGLRSDMSAAEIRRRKVRGFTAIPTGNFSLSLTYSPRFSPRAFYKSIGGLLPLVVGVPGFSRILMHCGNSFHDTQGCILLGVAPVIPDGSDYILKSSRVTFREVFLNYLLPSLRIGSAPLRIVSAF